LIKKVVQRAVKASHKERRKHTYIYLFTLFTAGVKTPPSRAVHLLLFTINKQKNNHKKRRINKTRRRV